MADRAERFQMRQRGAGARDIGDISFRVPDPSSEAGTIPDDASNSTDGPPNSITIGGPVQQMVPGRQERFEMRQRGAGARDVDFAMNLAVPQAASIPNAEAVQQTNAGRQERFEMRQRGAGARDVDFTMNLAVPPVSSPGQASSAGSVVSSIASRQREDISTINPTLLRQPQSTIQVSATDADGTSTKRRRITPEVNSREEENVAEFMDGDSLPDVPEDESVIGGSVNVPVSSPVTGSASSTKKKRKKKKSVLPPHRRRKTTASQPSSSVVGEEEELESEQRQTQSNQNPRSVLAEDGNTGRSNNKIPSDVTENVEEAEDSVAGVNTSLANDQSLVITAGKPANYSIFNRQPQSKSSAPNPAVQRILQQHGVANKENRPANVTSKAKVTARPTKRTSQGQVKAKTKAKKATKANSQSGGSTRKSGVVVTVHRMSHLSRLNFLEADNVDEDDGSHESESAYPTQAIKQKKAPNAIDVLSQICVEIVDKRIAALTSTSDDNHEQLPAETRRKAAALKLFSEELNARLLNMTTALDQHISLTSKLREATRRKTALRSEILELRRQRQDVELAQDDIRARNERDRDDANERFELNVLLADIELAVQRGREAEEHASEDAVGGGSGGDVSESLSMRLRRIGEVVSSAGGRVGLLDRVRAFNHLLEGIAER